MIYVDPQILQSQAFYAGVASLLFEKAKDSKYIPMINCDSEKLNKFIGIAIAFITAMGITMKYSYTAEGLFTLTVSNLTFWGIFNSLKTWGFQYMLQQVAYKNVIKKTVKTEK
jgi:hypothetical protein